MADFNVVAHIKANVSDFKRGLASAETSLKSLQKTSGSSFERISKGMETIGKGVTLAVTAPLAAAGVAGVREFGKFESALIGLGKTNNVQGKELEKLGDKFRELSREIPVSATELLKIGEAAGQLGIESKNLEEFTRTMADIAVATNMTSEQAANDFARLANITGMPQTEFKKLGSTVVALGNNMATTESEISAMSLRLAGAGKQVGLSEAQIMALAASMSSVGIEAEAGGSAFSRVMQKINTEVLSSGDKLEGFARVAGKSASDFAETWKKDPQSAITDFIEGLKRVQDSGGDVTETLKDLGINSIREIDTLARLAGAGDLVANAFDLANESWEEGTALTEEANRAYESFESQLQFLKNALSEVGVIIGGILAPAIKKIAEKIREWTLKFADLDERTQRIIVAVGAFLTALGPLLWIIGKVASWVPLIVNGFKLLQGVFLLLTSPIGLVVAAIAILIGVFVYLWNTNETFRNKIIEIWNAIKSFLIGVWDSIKSAVAPIWEEMVSTITNAWESISSFATDIWGQITNFITENQELIRNTISIVWEAIKSEIEAILNLIMPIVSVGWEVIKAVTQTAWEAIKIVVMTAWEMLKSIVQIGLDYILGFIKVVMQSINNDWQGAWEIVKETAIRIWEGIKQLIGVAFDFIQNLIDVGLNLLITIWGIAWNSIKEIVISIWNAIKQFIKSKIEEIKANISAVLNATKGIVGTILNAIKSVFSNIFNSLKGVVTNAFNNVRGAVRSGMTSAWNTVKGFASRFFSAGRNIVQNIANGIKSAVGLVTSAISGVVQRVRDYLPFSPPKDKSSPLKDIHKNGIGTQIATGIERGQGVVDRAMYELLQTPSDLAMDVGSHQTIQHEIGSAVSRPIQVKTQLNVGGYEFREFTQVITETQQKQERLGRFYNDGTATVINANGIYTQEGHSQHKHHYLTDQKTFTVNSNGRGKENRSAWVWVQLDSKFRGKDFMVFSQISDVLSYETNQYPNNTMLQRVVAFVVQDHVDRVNARVPVYGFGLLTQRNRPTNQLFVSVQGTITAIA